MKIEKAIEVLSDVIESCNHNQTDEWLERKKAYDMAISALEKQGAKKVECEIEDIQEASGYSETCPNCHHFVFDNYCANCGQALSWDVHTNDVND